MKQLVQGFVAGIIFFGTILWIVTEARSLDWERVETVESPDGVHRLVHYQAHATAGHVPYGNTVVLESPNNYPRPWQGETIFAGQCETLTMEWGEPGIALACATEEAPTTMVATVLGTPVSLVSSPSPTNADAAQ